MSVEKLVVDGEHAGQRLDVFIAELCGSRSRAQRAIAEGAVSVDGENAAKRASLQEGQVVEVQLDVLIDEVPDFVVTGELPEIPILFEDEHLLVVDKPAGLVVHSGAGTHGPTLVDALAGRIDHSQLTKSEPERPGIVHRLDRDTSGLLLVARNNETHRALQQAISSRDVTREYLALVDGRPDARTGTIDAPIGRDRVHRTRVSLDTNMPRRAVTHFEIEEMLAASTLLRVKLETGRTHQIRVHLKAIGHSVCGDPEYGHAGRYGLQRQFLHAARLTFDHPITGERLQVTSELPQDLQEALLVARGGSKQ